MVHGQRQTRDVLLLVVPSKMFGYSVSIKACAIRSPNGYHQPVHIQLQLCSLQYEQ